MRRKGLTGNSINLLEHTHTQSKENHQIKFIPRENIQNKLPLAGQADRNFVACARAGWSDEIPGNFGVQILAGRAGGHWTGKLGIRDLGKNQNKYGDDLLKQNPQIFPIEKNAFKKSARAELRPLSAAFRTTLSCGVQSVCKQIANRLSDSVCGFGYLIEQQWCIVLFSLVID